MNSNSQLELKNSSFCVRFDPGTGGVTQLLLQGDPHGMNWAQGEAQWGTPAPIPSAVHVSSDNSKSTCDGYSVRQVSLSNGCLCAVYQSNLVTVTALRDFSPNGNFRERYTILNHTAAPVFLPRGSFGIYTTFNDNYQDIQTCLTQRCHTHLWCGGQVSYVCALRMSGQSPHLGLMLTQGSLEGYSVVRQEEKSSNDRGDFILCPGLLVLAPGESTQLEWELFPHEGREDFYRILMQNPRMIRIQAEHYTLFPGEPLRLRVQCASPVRQAQVRALGRDIPFTILKDTLLVDAALPQLRGEVPIHITVNGISTWLRVNFCPEYPHLLDTRTRYIGENQQFHGKGSSLDGAYLIYDTRERHQYYNAQFADHNAGRERLAMGAVMARRLQHRPDDALYASLMEYAAFVERELFDPLTGVVYNDARRDNSWHRNYNYPWVAAFFIELYHLTGEKSYLCKMALCMKGYYRHGGADFYAICMPMVDSIQALRQEGMEKLAGELLSLYREHGGHILKNSIFFPAHEVAYEQSIVTPALAILLQLYELTGEEAYWQEIQRQMPLLEAFAFTQPDCHLHEIAIRHWDGYWFGKRMQYGDTFPHYWSVLSADVFARYARLQKGADCTDYDRRAQEILRGNLCLFFEDGGASCAYLYPIQVNGRQGEYYDEWANDQDWALYYADKWLNEAQDKQL